MKHLSSAQDRVIGVAPRIIFDCVTPSLFYLDCNSSNVIYLMICVFPLTLSLPITCWAGGNTNLH